MATACPILGNWPQYLEITCQPMQQAESIHVRFLSNERALKFLAAQ
jgi:hypothetical protein